LVKVPIPLLRFCLARSLARSLATSMGPWSVNAPYVSGWALDARSAFGCMAGSWCPYACKSPYFETQYDNAVGQVRGIHLSPVSCRLLPRSQIQILAARDADSLGSRGSSKQAAGGRTG
jgi:hypothetical protein